MRVNIPKTYCGHVFILLEEKAGGKTVDIDNSGIGLLKNKSISIGDPTKYEIFCDGKDITAECTGVLITTLSTTGLDKRKYLSFTMQCETLDILREDRFSEIRNAPKVRKWLKK